MIDNQRATEALGDINDAVRRVRHSRIYKFWADGIEFSVDGEG